MVTKLSPAEACLLSSSKRKRFPSGLARSYATQNALGGTAGPSRKQITVASDDGRVRWSDLSTREKAARTTQQTFNFGIILAGMVMTVEGPLNNGVVNLHMTKSPGQSQYQYKYLALDVKGHSRIYLENADAAKGLKKTGMKMFGVKWTE
ncbi:hypothetical protein MMC08_005629 [Hypocenomyce scalaris]|nr:hypothetical protein [Hypocenomyce scalaris]